MSEIDEGVQAIVDLMTGQLSALKFPDVDGERLSDGVREVEAAARAVDAAEAALEAARAKLAAEAEVLLARAQRALAYLRVFAEGDSTLQARVGEISLRGGACEMPRAEPMPRRRRRATSVDGPTPLLAVMEAGPRDA